jgi:ribosomal protein L11 methyltransferase
LASVPALDLSWRSAGDVDLLTELLQAALDDFQPLAIHDHVTADGWRVFFRSLDQRNRAFAAIAASFGDRLAGLHRLDVIDEGWAQRSQASLTAIRVGHIIVTPPWDVTPLSSDSDVLIVIDPSTGFGTGHHETTRLCLQLLQEDGVAQDVIDVGTGSGVLAIAAAKLGATSVVAFDEDPDALRNARENVDRNQVADRVVLQQLELNADFGRQRLRSRPSAHARGSSERGWGSASVDERRAALVMANLTSGVLLKYAAALIDLVEPSGRLLISGFHPDDLPDLLSAFGDPSCTQASEGDWLAAILRLSSDRTRN